MRAELRTLVSALLIPVVLWLVFSAAYILLVSEQYTAVDGALRCLAVYWHRPPYVGPNNHLLYPASVWLWSHVASMAGASAQSPMAFLHLAAALNALCAGGSIAVIYVLVRRLTEDWKGSLLAALVYALSWSLLVHATSSAEPLPGLFVSLIAALFTIVGLLGERLAPLFASGVFLALALASYESMFLVAPLLYLLCAVCPARSNLPDRATRLLPMLAVFVSILGTVTGVGAIYGIVYYSIGITTPREMVHSLFRLGGEPEVYAGFQIAKLANLPAGFVGNLIGILPADYRGMRWLLGTDKGAFAAIAAVFLFTASASIMLARFAGTLWRSRRARAIAGVCGAGLLFELFPLLYWDPIYSKLWLQPLALLTILGGVLGGWMGRIARRRFAGVVVLLIAVELAVNVPQVVFAHFEPTRCLDDALIANQFIRPSDRVVTDFDSVSSLWMGFYDHDPARTLLFPATAPSTSLTTLDRWARECASSGCRILFVALLDQPRDIWEAFLGRRLKVDYATLASYRRLSPTIHKFSCEDGSLRIYEPAAIEMGASPAGDDTNVVSHKSE
jgi:hypothetical protein